MRLLTTQQIQEWDKFTITNEPITSLNLMERAANACTSAITQMLFASQKPFESIYIFCGKGNNGGDGLAIARLLSKECSIPITVYILEYIDSASDDFIANEKKLDTINNIRKVYLKQPDNFPIPEANTLVIDALFGTGINRPLNGLSADLVRHINTFKSKIIAIDMPSGLPGEVADHVHLERLPIIKADITLTFQAPKFSFMHAESAEFVGEFKVLDIGLEKRFFSGKDFRYYFTDAETVNQFIKPRGKFGHKGIFGHLLTIGGSYGKMGASVLMNKAALRTGCGLVTAFVPKVGYTILQQSIPECMVLTGDEMTEIRHFPNELSGYNAICVGPGLGLHEKTIQALYRWLPTIQLPCVIDADALNICSRLILEHHETFAFPANCIITPHPKEFDRLAGISVNSYERLEKQIHFAVKYKIVVVLKGAHTSLAMPNGTVYFNSTGNVAMATAGSGDALTGILGSLLAQGFNKEEAALFGVYLHGLAGDETRQNQATMLASDLIENLPIVLNQFHTTLL